jgi:hypothetical protein
MCAHVRGVSVHLLSSEDHRQTRVLRSHLPLMFIGMEHIILSNYGQADETLDAANAMCDGDPLLINERGVMAFNHGRCPLTEFLPDSI